MDDSACQNCGRLIWGDAKGYDDIVSGPFVTESGDLYCIQCGRSHEASQAERDEDEAYLWIDPFEDDLDRDAPGKEAARHD